MISTKQAQLIQFLRWELAIPASSIAMALRHPEQESGQLPMILWQYGLVTLEQLDKIFDWLEQFGNTPDLKPRHQPEHESRSATRNPMPLASSSYVA